MSKLIVRERREVERFSHHDYNSFSRKEVCRDVVYYDVYAGKINPRYLLQTYKDKGAALAFADDVGQILGTTVETLWDREYRVTTTVKAKSAEAALDRISGDDLEIRRAATVVSV